MGSSIITGLLIVLGFGFIIFVHELGHFTTAKLFKIKVHDFFIGFGPKLIKKKIGETEYGIAAIPLGGYVRLSGMEEEAELEPEEEALSFRAQARWKRVLVLIAGPFTNILFAIPLFFIVVINTPLVVGATNEIANVSQESAAHEAGLKEGDLILGLDGNAVEGFEDIHNSIEEHKKAEDLDVTVRYERDGDEESVDLTLKPIETADGLSDPVLGIGTVPIVGDPTPPGEAFMVAVRIPWDILKLFGSLIGSLFTGDTSLGEVAETSAGPVGIVSILGESFGIGFVQFLWTVAVIGVSVGIINLLPLLPLDGGRIVIVAVEAIIRRPVSAEWIGRFSAFGIVLFLLLVVILTYNDIGRLIEGRSFLDAP